jgi:hypothetical protein
MSGIFIGYRREDSAGFAGRLADALAARFGHEHIFRDLEDIQPGDDFVSRIEEAVASSGVLLIVIGPRWLGITDEEGNLRLSKPHDFVRLEIAAALRRGTRVIPVLVGGARMPEADELPHDIADLARRHAHELSDARWSYDVGRLIDLLVSAGLAEARSKPLTASSRGDSGARRSKFSPRTWALVAAVIGVALFGVLNVARWAESQGRTETAAAVETLPDPHATRIGEGREPASSRAESVALAKPGEASANDTTESVTPNRPRLALRPRTILLHLHGSPPLALAAAKASLMELLAAQDYEVLDGSAAGLGSSSTPNPQRLVSVARARGAGSVVIGVLEAQAQPSVGTFYTGTASIVLSVYSASDGRNIDGQTVQVGGGGVPGKLGASEDAARNEASTAVGRLAARAVASQIPSRR